MPEDVLSLAQALLACPSVTPNDAGCLRIVEDYLSHSGFSCETIRRATGGVEVSNVWACRLGAQGDGGVTIVFAGHVDVVPVGQVSDWKSPAFEPTVRDGKLYARGASDMKTPLAAMMVAASQYTQAQPNTSLNIAFLITADEEGPALDGTVAVCDTLSARGTRIDYCIVGEPTAIQCTGDMIKNGRRGSLSGKLIIRGKQGHIAYPHLARNPIHLAAPALVELTTIEWDAGNDYFPPTSWQISNIHAGTGASNVIPAQLEVDFNFRFSTASSVEQLQQKLESVLQQHQLDFEVQWTVSGLPFLTPQGVLVDIASQAVRDVVGITPELSTSGGTSDGRFIAQICPQVIELGPPNTTIHQVNENIALADMEALAPIYYAILEKLEAQHAKA